MLSALGPGQAEVFQLKLGIFRFGKGLTNRLLGSDRITLQHLNFEFCVTGSIRARKQGREKSCPNRWPNIQALSKLRWNPRVL
jgi:hypothetical protein